MAGFYFEILAPSYVVMVPGVFYEPDVSKQTYGVLNPGVVV